MMSEVKTLRYMFDWASAMCSDGPRGWSTLVEKDIPHPGFFEDGQAKNLVELIDKQDYDALAAQRDEGLAREAELQKQCEWRGEMAASNGREYEKQLTANNTLQQRLAEVEKDVKTGKALLRESWAVRHDECLEGRVEKFLASPSCADGEKP